MLFRIDCIKNNCLKVPNSSTGKILAKILYKSNKEACVMRALTKTNPIFLVVLSSLDLASFINC